jgi:hypothetical protein
MKRFTKRKYMKRKSMRGVMSKEQMDTIQMLIDDTKHLDNELKHTNFVIGFANLSLLYLGRRTKEYIH